MPAPTSNDLIEISSRVYERTRDLLTLRGRDWERPEELDEGALTREPLLADCAEASARGVGLLGDQAGQHLLPHLARVRLPIKDQGIEASSKDLA